MTEWVENKHPISPATWVDGAAKLNVLRSPLDDKLYELEHTLAVRKADLMMAEDVTNAKAETIIKASEEYKEMRKLSAKIKQLEEFIRIAKKQATLRDNEYMSGK